MVQLKSGLDIKKTPSRHYIYTNLANEIEFVLHNINFTFILMFMETKIV